MKKGERKGSEKMANKNKVTSKAKETLKSDNKKEVKNVEAMETEVMEVAEEKAKVQWEILEPVKRGGRQKVTEPLASVTRNGISINEPAVNLLGTNDTKVIVAFTDTAIGLLRPEDWPNKTPISLITNAKWGGAAIRQPSLVEKISERGIKEGVYPVVTNPGGLVIDLTNRVGDPRRRQKRNAIA